MYASIHRSDVDVAHTFRFLAAASATVLFISWLTLLVSEMISREKWLPNLTSYDQAIVLAVLFASYVIGWRHELVGAALTFVAMLAFFSVGYRSTETFPPLAAIWLATPGVLYLLAWYCGGRSRRSPSESK
jgi:hypothetical protein